MIEEPDRDEKHPTKATSDQPAEEFIEQEAQPSKPEDKTTSRSPASPPTAKV